MTSLRKKFTKGFPTKKERERIKKILSAIPESQTLFPEKLARANYILSRTKFMDDRH